jgi:hypothetical protein
MPVILLSVDIEVANIAPKCSPIGHLCAECGCHGSSKNNGISLLLGNAHVHCFVIQLVMSSGTMPWAWKVY